MNSHQSYLLELLDRKYEQYNNIDFIQNDPLSIPHGFSGKCDIEISAFFAATLAWGQRKTTIANCKQLMQWMDNSPYQFITGAGKRDLYPFKKFTHRTFNGDDAFVFIVSLQKIYSKYGDMENFFASLLPNKEIGEALHDFKTMFFAHYSTHRARKHIGDPNQNSTAKRMCMFLRWMVRKNDGGVDFGIWNRLSPAWLACPLDVHTQRAAIACGLLTRKQSDWKAVAELTNNLRILNPHDPIKYDIALFSLSQSEQFGAV